jgi:hypothetical protein
VDQELLQYLRAGKHPDVIEEVLKICVITGRMDGRKILINFSGTPSRPIASEHVTHITLEKAKERAARTKLPVDR